MRHADTTIVAHSINRSRSHIRKSDLLSLSFALFILFDWGFIHLYGGSAIKLNI